MERKIINSKNNIIKYHINKELKSINKIIKELNKKNKILRNEIEDTNKKNHDIMKEVEKLKILYKNALKKI